LPYTILEAGSAKLPVVASRTGGIPDIIHHEETGILIQPKNERELTRALSTLIEQSSERVRLGKALRENINNNFTKDKMVAETLKIYT